MVLYIHTHTYIYVYCIHYIRINTSIRTTPVAFLRFAQFYIVFYAVSWHGERFFFDEENYKRTAKKKWKKKTSGTVIPSLAITSRRKCTRRANLVVLFRSISLRNFGRTRHERARGGRPWGTFPTVRSRRSSVGTGALKKLLWTLGAKNRFEITSQNQTVRFGRP